MTTEAEKREAIAKNLKNHEEHPPQQGGDYLPEIGMVIKDTPLVAQNSAPTTSAQKAGVVDPVDALKLLKITKPAPAAAPDDAAAKAAAEAARQAELNAQIRELTKRAKAAEDQAAKEAEPKHTPKPAETKAEVKPKTTTKAAEPKVEVKPAAEPKVEAVKPKTAEPKVEEKPAGPVLVRPSGKIPTRSADAKYFVLMNESTGDKFYVAPYNAGPEIAANNTKEKFVKSLNDTNLNVLSNLEKHLSEKFPTKSKELMEAAYSKIDKNTGAVTYEGALMQNVHEDKASHAILVRTENTTMVKGVKKPTYVQVDDIKSLFDTSKPLCQNDLSALKHVDYAILGARTSNLLASAHISNKDSNEILKDLVKSVPEQHKEIFVKYWQTGQKDPATSISEANKKEIITAEVEKEEGETMQASQKPAVNAPVVSWSPVNLPKPLAQVSTQKTVTV